MKISHVVAAFLLLAGAAEAGRDNLVIGVTQFPSTMHPNIDPESIKGYALGFALRSVTAYDKTWRNTCLLC